MNAPFPKLQRPTKFKPKYIKDGQSYEISVKFDGIRCVIHGGKALSRTGKPIPNRHIRDTIESMGLPDGFGGEIVILDSNGVPSFQLAQSQVMAFEGTPDFRFIIFEAINNPSALDWCFVGTDESLYPSIQTQHNPKLHFAVKWASTNLEEIFLAFEKWVSLGYEGLIIREMADVYGSTPACFKLKKRESAEATLVGMKQLIRKDGTKAPMVGALEVKGANGKVYSVGTGFTEAQRTELWANRNELLESAPAVSISYDSLSSHGIPRFPTYNGFRHPDTCLPQQPA